LQPETVLVQICYASRYQDKRYISGAFFILAKFQL
jgi:hypothetical protein